MKLPLIKFKGKIIIIIIIVNVKFAMLRVGQSERINARTSP